MFLLLLPDLHTGFSRGRSGGLVVPSPEEFSTVYCDPHSQRLWHKAEIDVFLELFCFFDDPADVGNLISGSSAFSKTSSYKKDLHDPYNHDDVIIHLNQTSWNVKSSGP